MHDYVKLFKLGAHHFLTLTLCIALFERDYTEPLECQREYACSLPPALVAALPEHHHETRARKQVNLYEGRMAKL